MTKSTRFSLALITGASSGIGLALSRLLAREGIPLMITGRQEASLVAVSEELSSLAPVEIIVADLSNPFQRAMLIKRVVECAPDLIVNNAGIGLYGDALSHPTESQMEILHVNAAALLEITLEGVRALIAKKSSGVIMNVSSAADCLVFPGLAVYAASKAFVTQVSLSLDEELRSQGIRILTASPGVVATEFRWRSSEGKAVMAEGEGMSAQYAAQHLLRLIKKRKQGDVFDLRTRIARALSRWLLPQRWVARYLASHVRTYLGEKK